MRISIIAVLGIMLWGGLSLAQEDKIAVATTALQSVLATLQDSVQKLSLNNDQLAAKDEAIKRKVSELQMQLGALQARGESLERQAAPLQAIDSDRDAKIEHLQDENSDLDDQIQKAQEAIKSIQQSLNTGYQEDQKLLLHLKELTNVLSTTPKPSSPETPEERRFQKEKLKLMKMIFDSQHRQAALQESILEIKKSAGLLPAASALAHQQFLKEQIKDLEGQLASSATENKTFHTSSAYQWDSNQLRQLEEELRILENNYKQLKSLMAQMDKKAKIAQMTGSQQVEGEKLQNSLDDLEHQGEGLRAQLDDLRSQMVDLDKRKSTLETMIQHLP